MSVALPVVERPPGEAVSVYEAMAEPPSNAGGVKCTCAKVSKCSVTCTLVGGSGTVRGVTASDCSDGALVPSAFVAVTEKRYACPFVRPGTVIGLYFPVAVAPPGDAVTLYDVTG